MNGVDVSCAMSCLTGRATGRLRGAAWAGAAVALLASVLCGCSKSVGPETYIRDLGDERKEVRTKAVDELARMQDDAVPYVIEAFLKAPATDRGVREVESAVEAMSKFGTPEGLEALGSRITDPDQHVRLATITGVGRLAEVRKSLGVKLLEQAIGDPDPTCVRAAAMGLTELGLADATAVLVRFLERGLGCQAVFAAEGLYRLDRRPAAAQYLLDSLSSGDDAVRSAAQLSVAELRDRFVGPLVDFTTAHAGAEDQEAALGQMRDGVLEELKRILPASRVEAIIEALGNVADRESCAALMGIVAGREWAIQARVAAAAALGDAATSSRPAGVRKDLRDTVQNALKETLRAEGADSRVRIACAISLCRLKDPEGVEYLLAQLESLERAGSREPALTELRIRAQEALTSSGEFVVPYLIKALQNPQGGDVTSWAASATLGTLRVQEAVPHLGRLLLATIPAGEIKSRPGDPAETFRLDTKRKPVDLPTTRRAVLRELFRDEPVIPAREPAVRMAAALALGRIGGEEAIRLLQQGLAIHETVHARTRACIERREYSKLIPQEAINDEQKSQARGVLSDICSRIIRDEERVLFYIRLGLKEAQPQAEERGRQGVGA